MTWVDVLKFGGCAALIVFPLLMLAGTLLVRTLERPHAREAPDQDYLDEYALRRAREMLSQYSRADMTFRGVPVTGFDRDDLLRFITFLSQGGMPKGPPPAPLPPARSYIEYQRQWVKTHLPDDAPPGTSFLGIPVTAYDRDELLRIVCHLIRSSTPTGRPPAGP